MKFIDFFAGMGGFTMGFQRAGHTPVGWCEIDKYAQKAYRAIHEPKGEWFHDDIRAVDPWELPDADCYTFGFPCQSFSIAGKRGGFEDTRGTLFFEVMRLAKVRQPKILVAENVAGLLNHDGGRTFGTIINAMDELGYSAEWQVLNSKDFGVPQNRERVFIVGHLRGRSRPKVFPIRGTNQKALKQLVGGSQGYRVYDAEGISCTLASEAGGMGAKTGLYLMGATIDKPGNMDTCTIGVMFKGPSDISNTVRTGGKGSLTKKHNWDVINDGIRIRRLTPKECFRLQGFPDWAFEKAKAAGISDRQLYKIAGNSVTIEPVYEIAKRL